MVKQLLIAAAAVVALGDALPVSAQNTQPAAAQAAPTPNDYSKDASWLCRPGRQDACDVDLTTTVVEANGTLRREPFQPAAAPAIDCFYVYPTVSTDTGTYSDMNPDPVELNVVGQQFARFRQVCRPFAPMYRQVTLIGLRRILADGDLTPLGTGPQFEDVRQAWRHYLEHDNQGRGVVLIGHSQGAYILTALLASEIDGKPAQERLVSAILMGTSVAVPKGKDAGGVFRSVALCRKPTDTGCVISFSSFRSTVPAPANSLFGVVRDPAMTAACTNPAALGGGSGSLHAYLDAKGRTIAGTTPPRPWVSNGAAIDTPWVSVPGMLTAACATNEHAAFLSVTVQGNASDPRVDDIGGDLGAGQQVLANWGLHLVDVNLAMGNLLEIVEQQAKAFAAKK